MYSEYLTNVVKEEYTLEEKEKLLRDYLEAWKEFMGADREIKKTYKKIEIQIEGVKGTAVLLENQAPKICAAFCKRLPVEGYFMHAIWGGECVRMVRQFDLGEVPPENRTYFHCPGDLDYTPFKELGICYGEASPRTPSRLAYAYPFARIIENFKELKIMCIRTRLEGVKKFIIRATK